MSVKSLIVLTPEGTVNVVADLSCGAVVELFAALVNVDAIHQEVTKA
jgi:hypothetical protein